MPQTQQDALREIFERVHPTAHQWAKRVVTAKSKLSLHVPATEKTYVTGHDTAGRILSTVKVSLPAHKRDFDHIARKQLAAAEKKYAGDGVSLLFDILAPTFATRAWERLKFLAAEKDCDAFWSEAVKWYTKPVSIKMGKGRTMEIHFHPEGD